MGLLGVDAGPVRWPKVSEAAHCRALPLCCSSLGPSGMYGIIHKARVQDLQCLWLGLDIFMPADSFHAARVLFSHEQTPSGLVALPCT